MRISTDPDKMIALLDRVRKFFTDYQPIFAFLGMLCTVLILVGSIIFVWLPSMKSPDLDVYWSSSWGNKVENRLYLANQSQSKPINITLEIHNTGNAPAHNVGVLFEYTTGIGSYDYLLIYENNQYRTKTYGLSYQHGLLQNGHSLYITVLFRISFYGIWTSSSKPQLIFQVFSTEIATRNVEIEIHLV